MPKKSGGSLHTEKGSLVNRGGAGLLKKLPDSPDSQANGEAKVDPTRMVLEGNYGKKDNIRCEGKVVKIADLTPDPNNARVHNARNLEAIQASLKLYGQMKPIVVRKQDMVVAAGNGTLASASALGWSKLACSVIPMTDEEFAGYGLADNKTAELAQWNFEVMARLDKFLQERGTFTIGWTSDELEVLRAADWTPPSLDEGAEFGANGEQTDPLIVSFTPDQYYIVGQAIAKVREQEPTWDQAMCLTAITKEFLEGVS